MKTKVLVVADCEWWAFGKIYRGLRDYCDSERFEISVHYTDRSHEIPHHHHDVVLFLTDHIPGLVFQNRIPREKLIWCIRMGRQCSVDKTREDMYPIYADAGALTASARVLAVANETIAKEFAGMHQDIVVAPGGVDTRVFSYTGWLPHCPPVVGWAGCNQGRGKDFRNLTMIQAACDTLGYAWRPALREQRLRTELEMVEYYQREIDIYVEMGTTAGRQNGMLEAGACGCPIISADVGVAGEIIVDGVNGFMCERTQEDITGALKKIPMSGNRIAESMRKTIEREWSWRAQAKIFEEMFDTCSQ